MGTIRPPVRNASKALERGLSYFFYLINAEDGNCRCDTIEAIALVRQKVAALKLFQHP